MIRRLIVMVVVLGIVAAVVDLTHATRTVSRTVFTNLATPTTPYLPTRELITATYYCMGVPAASKTDGGEIVVTNPTDVPVTGQLEAYTDAGALAPQTIAMAPRSQRTFPVDTAAATGYVGVTVELAHNGLAVEQRTHSAAGTAIGACSPDASQRWFFADGVTGDGSTYSLVLTNPFPDDAVVDMTFVTATDQRQPNLLQDYVIPARSVRVVDVAGVARNENQLSIVIQSRRGRFVAAKAQSFSTTTRSGFVLALGAPSTATSWYLADGDKGTGIAETVSVLNPTATAVDVDLTVVADQGGVLPAVRTTIEPLQTILVDIGAQIKDGAGQPISDGHYSLTVSVATLGTTAGVVVERALTKTVANSKFTTVVLGAQFTSSNWWAPLGVPSGTQGALVVTNTSGQAGTFSVNAVGPGGANPITGMDAVPIASGATVFVDLTADGAVNVPIVIKSTNVPLVVEQRYPRGSKPGRSGALAIPE